ncbi:MAG: NUDIX hydrolase [Hyphomonadaceae bacterium]|nr:NUDIX hydrolase [Hyphomonadaceae bacterium]
MTASEDDLDWSGANPWRIKAKREAFANDWFRVETHDVVNPAGKDGAYGVIRIRRTAVGVLPIDARGRVRLVGQWRFPLARYSWEMPEGGAEPGEAPEACARRELQEETGLAAGALIEIGRLDLSNSLTDETAVLYLAYDLEDGPAAPEETEVLAGAWAPFRACLDWAAAGKITDAMTVAALWRAYHMASEGLLPAALAAAMLERTTSGGRP